MKSPTPLARLELALIETQYALSDFSHEIEVEAGIGKEELIHINDDVIRISLSLLRLLASISSMRAVRSCEGVQSSEDTQQVQASRVAAFN